MLMSAAHEPIADPREQRRRLDDLDTLLERLLAMPLPTRLTVSAAHGLQVMADEIEPALDLEPPAAAQPPVAKAGKRHEIIVQATAPEAPTAAHEGSVSSANADVHALQAPVAGGEIKPPAPLSAPGGIASIAESPVAPPRPASLPRRGLAAFDDVASRPLIWLGLDWLKPALGWIGLLLLAGAAAMAIGSWLGLQTRF
jgi:hypothetical protein